MEATGNSNQQVPVMDSRQFIPVNATPLAQVYPDDQSSVDSAFVDAPSVEATPAVIFPVETPSDGSAPAEAPSAETTLVESSPVSSPPKRKVEEDLNSDNESVVSKKPKTDTPASNGGQRKKTTKTKASRPIPRSYKDCEDHDKKLIDMYEAGHTWPEIRVGWYDITKERTANSTLPNRYQRLMNNFTVIPDTDKVKLIEAKQKIEKQFEDEKWSKVALEMQSNGACLYQKEVLERQHKKMMLEAEELPPVGSSAAKKKKTKEGPESVAGDDDTIDGDELA